MDSMLQGQPELFYKVSKATEKNVLEGMVLSLRSLRAAGARRLMTLHNSYTVYTPGHGTEVSSGDVEDTDACFEEWLRGVEKKGAGAHDMQLFSAHQVSALSHERPPNQALLPCYLLSTYCECGLQTTEHEQHAGRFSSCFCA